MRPALRMQIDPVEVCDLLALTNRVGSFQFDPKLTLEYYELLGRLVQGQELEELEWDFLRRTVQTVPNQDFLLWNYIERNVVDGRVRTALRQWLDDGRLPRGRDRLLLNRLFFAVSPLARVMQRHTRGLLDVYRRHGDLQQNLAERHVLPLIPPLSFNALEQKAYDRLEAYCEGLNRQIHRNSEQSRQMMSFLLNFLRLRFASSLFALRETLQRRLVRVEAGRLLERLVKTNLVVGTQPLSLLPIGPTDFQELADGKLTPDQLEERARARISLQQQRTASMEIPPEDLYDIYRRAAEQGERKAPVDLEAIWQALTQSEYLRGLGCHIGGEEGEKIFDISRLGDVPPGSVLTVSRELWETGSADEDINIHFASYGDSVFETILAKLNAFALPDCVKRLVVPVPGLDGVEMVGYAAACRSQSGSLEVRLVCAWEELEGLELAETVQLTDTLVEPLRRTLEVLAQAEFVSVRAVPSIERDNLRAAYGQELLNFLVMDDLMGVRARSAGESAPFWQVLRSVEALFEEREFVTVYGLPVAALKPVQADLLFECSIPQVGDKTNVRVSRILAHTGLDAVCRVVENMKVKRSELSAERVLARLKHEAQAAWHKCAKG